MLCLLYTSTLSCRSFPYVFQDKCGDFKLTMTASWLYHNARCFGDGGGGGVFPCLQRVWGKVRPFIPRLRFFFFYYLKWKSSRECKFHFLGQYQSTAAQRAETTVAECSFTSCVWARFPDRVPNYAWTAWSAHSDFAGSRVYACLGVTAATCTFGRMTRVFYVPLRWHDVERTPNKSQHRKLILAKKLLLPLLPGLELAIFQQRVQRTQTSYHGSRGASLLYTFRVWRNTCSKQSTFTSRKHEAEEDENSIPIF